MHKPLILATLCLGLAACGGKQGALDEYAVARNAPLILPPDYTLEPPRAGTISQSVGETQAQAIEALFGGPAPRSSGEAAVLGAASQGRVPVGTRSNAGDPQTRVIDKGAETQTILSSPELDGQDASADTPQ
ncbi:DUF3035 domain-containing protein [Sphingomicrobium clamense]|uniref:DUF3035 domain-containing protein n=1 Tax=Sphingomicrobium clamense TaxID=2851013 RepID=A0ABS6V473_9SPHN|nr:DUF3035 domain-containing protein [Sphingomicrobium sp. B8]MBW0144348.1 DUF3035 domain-containing protein [Sphingomicrobium sp. B8]